MRGAYANEHRVEGAYLWLRDNWFPLLQSAGIMGGLLFTALSIRQATNARRVSDLLALTEQHRELWNDVYRRPELSRIFAAADLVAKPVTIPEERFLNEVIVHFTTGWHLAQRNSLLTMDALKADLRTFFRLPIPRAIWEQTKEGRDPKFVHFMESCLKSQ